MTATHSRRKVLGSASWATGQQVVMLASTAITGVILARTLSVADVGVFSYAVALAGIGTAFMTGGLSGLAIKALVDAPEQQHRTMAALVLIREALAAVAYAVLVLFALLTGDADTTAMTAVALLALFARGLDATELYFQSRVESHRSAAVRIVVVATLLAVRVVLAFTGASLLVFVVLYVVEAAATSLGMLVRFLRADESPGFGTPEVERARELLGQSWLVLASGVAGQINLRADLVLINALMSTTAVGTYAAAARLSELPYFLPVVFMTATFPVLLGVRREHGPESPQYLSSLQRSYDQACWIGIGVAAAIWLVGPWLIVALYGQAYEPAGEILRIHVLALPFVFMAAVFSKWIIAEGHLWASLIRHGFGALLNIALNLVLIPPYGLKGAAVATVCSYTVASYLACFVGRKTRPAGVQMTRALLAPAFLLRRRVAGAGAGASA